MKRKLLCFMVALCLVCLSGCSNKEAKQKENPFEASNHITEEMITFPHIMNMGKDIMIDKNGEYLFLGKKESGETECLWRMGDDNKWEAIGFLPKEFNKSTVQRAYFFDEKNFFLSIAYDFDREGSKFDVRHYSAYIGNGSEIRLIQLSETINHPQRKNSIIFGITMDSKVTSFNSKSGALVKSYDTSNLLVERYFVTEDKIIALGSNNYESNIVETYDIKTGEICETKDSLKTFFVSNLKKRGGPPYMYYENESQILYCVNAEGIFSYDINSEREQQPVQNKNCTPFRNRLPVSGIKVCNNVLLLNILSGGINPQEPQVYVYTAE